jgi:TetR/AcrR family transcriptional regulator
VDQSGPAWEERIVDRSWKSSEESRRNRLLDTTRRIVSAGIEIVAESGTGAFTVQDVVDRAGTSLHSFYRFFPSKDDLSLAIFEEVNLTGTAQIAEIAKAGKTAIERLRLTIVAPLQGTFRHPQGVARSFVVGEDLRLAASRPREMDAAFDPYRRLLAAGIDEAQVAGYFHGISPAEDASMIQRLQMSMYHLIAQGVPSVQTVSLDEALWDFCYGALRRRSSPEGASGAQLPGSPQGWARRKGNRPS